MDNAPFTNLINRDRSWTSNRIVWLMCDVMICPCANFNYIRTFIPLKSPVWGSHLRFVRWRSRIILGTICLDAVGCGWPVLWANLCLRWVKLVFALFPETSCVPKGFQYQQQFFQWFSQYHLKGTTEIYKEINEGFKLEWISSTYTYRVEIYFI